MADSIQGYIKAETEQIISSIMQHMNDDNRLEIFGEGIRKFYKSGTGKTLVRMCLGADVLRIIADAVFADSELSEDEAKLTCPFINDVMDVLSKFRDEYTAFTNLNVDSVAECLDFYQRDSQHFGYTFETTKWSGLNICCNVAAQVGVAEPLETYVAFTRSLTHMILEEDGKTEEEEEYINGLQGILRSRCEQAGIDLTILENLDLSNIDTDEDGEDAVEGIDCEAASVGHAEDSQDLTGESDHKYYIEFRPGTGRLLLQIDQCCRVDYSHTGWFSDAPPAITFANPSTGSSIAEEQNEISPELGQNILRYVRDNTNQMFEAAQQGQTAECNALKLQDVLVGAELSWEDAISQCGKPRNGSSCTAEEWQQAQNDRRAVTIVYCEEDYVGVISQFPDGYCRLIFGRSVPAETGWIAGYDDSDVIEEESEALGEQENVTQELINAIQGNDLGSAEAAIARSPDIDHQHEDNGNTPILLAIEGGNPEMVKLIAKCDPDFSIENWEDRLKPWLKARVLGHKEIADILVAHGAEEELGEAFQHAVTEGLLDLATALLDEGADADGEADDSGHRTGTPPIVLAASNGHQEIVEMLVKHGADVHKKGLGEEENAYLAAFSHGFFELANRMKDLGCTVDETLAMILSARRGNLNGIEKCIAAGTDVNGRREYIYNQTTALEHAVTSDDISDEENGENKNRRVEIVARLLENGADPNTSNDDGTPVLFLAVNNNRSDAANCLIQHGADKNLTDKESGYPLFLYAALNSDAKTIEAIAQAGADVTICDTEGNSALKLYIENSTYFDAASFKSIARSGAPLDSANAEGKTVTDIITEKLESLEDHEKQTFQQALAATAVECMNEENANIKWLANAYKEITSFTPDEFDEFDHEHQIIAVQAIEKTGFDGPIGEKLLEHYSNGWNEELKLAIRSALITHGYELPLEPEVLTELDAETAKTIIDSTDEDTSSLDFNSLTSLSPEAARILVGAPCKLLLNGLESLSDEAAECLSNHQGETLGLDGLTSLSPKSASLLSEYQNNLWLDGLSEISSECAAALAGGQKQLMLNGITELASDVARALSNHRGELWLNGLQSISEEAAEALARHAGVLSMTNLESISNTAAESLKLHQGKLHLQLDYITPESSADILRDKVGNEDEDAEEID